MLSMASRSVKPPGEKQDVRGVAARHDEGQVSQETQDRSALDSLAQ
jgi:hypothetical protein